MPHLVFQIDEILRPIAENVGRVSKPTAVKFARCCRAFEEPALRPLWENATLENLMYVLPADVLYFSGPGLHVRTFRQLTPTERARLFRYASWVRKLSGLAIGDLVCFLQVLFGLPTDDPFPNLRELHGCIVPALLRFLHRFMSPCLTDFSVYLSKDKRLRCSAYESLTNAISAITGPPLRRFSLGEYQWENATTKFKQEVSSMVLRCGSELNYLNPGVELSDQAVLHVIQLPHLHTLKLARESPPDITDTFPQDTIVLPSVHTLTLATSTAHAWLAFLNDLRWRHPTAAPTTRPGQSQAQIGIHYTLKRLYCGCGDAPKRAIIKEAIAFRNVTTLEVGQFCPDDMCSFDLTDDDVTAIAEALPQLHKIQLGHPCRMNTCQTTFRSLLTLSTNCVGLTQLTVHFKTTNIVEDVKSLLETQDPVIQELCKGPKCRITSLPVFMTPLMVDKPNTDLVAKGLLFVFPMLGKISSGHDERGTAKWMRVGNAISRLKLKELHDPVP